jgi:hypothetical protein
MKTEKKMTACESGPYPWIPANCQEDADGNWYFYITWHDHEFMGTWDGWEGEASCGTRLFHPLNMTCDDFVQVIQKGHKKRWKNRTISDGASDD